MAYVINITELQLHDYSNCMETILSSNKTQCGKMTVQTKQLYHWPENCLRASSRNQAASDQHLHQQTTKHHHLTHLTASTKSKHTHFSGTTYRYRHINDKIISGCQFSVTVTHSGWST